MRKAITLAIGASGIFVSGPAFAQVTSAANNPDHLETLKSCQTIADDSARLACYDNAVGGVVTASDSGDLQFVDREDVKKTRRRLFGFSIPDLGLFGADGDRKKEDKALEILESTITSVRYSRSDALTFKIKEGDAVWRITNAPGRLQRVKSGDKVVFKKAALGSYFIRINGQTGVKGRRIR